MSSSRSNGYLTASLWLISTIGLGVVMIVMLGLGATTGVSAMLPALQDPTSTPDESYEQLVAQAELLLSEGYLERALPLLEEAAGINPTSYDIWTMLAEVYFNLNRYEDAARAGETLVKLAPLRITGWYVEGTAKLVLGQYEEACPILERALEMDTAHVGVRKNLATCLQETGDYEAAINHFTLAAERSPEDASIYFNRGNAYRDLGQCGRAIIDYQRATELDPLHADVYNNMANCYQQQGQLEEAVWSIDSAIAIAPSAKFFTNKAEYLRALGRFEEALVAVETALNLDENYALAHRALGSIRYEQGNVTEALEAYTKGTSLAPGDASIWFNLGVAHSSQEHYAEAAKAWERVVNLGPEREEFALAANNLALLYTNELETSPDRAVELAQQALDAAKTDDERVFYWGTLAWIYLKQAECEAAVEAVSTGLNLNPADIRLQRYASLIENQCGE